VTDGMTSLEPFEVDRFRPGSQSPLHMMLGAVAFVLGTAAMSLVLAWAWGIAWLVYGLLALALVVESLRSLGPTVRRVRVVLAVLFSGLFLLVVSVLGAIVTYLLLAASCVIPNTDCATHAPWVKAVGPVLAILVLVGGCWGVWRLGIGMRRRTMPATPFRFFAATPAPVLSPDTRETLGRLVRDGEYTALQVVKGEVLVEDREGRRGWAPESVLPARLGRTLKSANP
jgi:hypothetical protein